MKYIPKFTDNIPQLLKELNINILFSSNTAGRVFFVYSDGERILQNGRKIKKPMGIALKDNKLAIAGLNHTYIYKEDKKLANTYYKNSYDTLYYPMANYISYLCNHHDLAFTNQGLVSVVTQYSCLARLDTNGEYSFEPIWKPFFINKLKPLDSCHLNGMAVDKQGEIRYVSAFSTTGVDSNWRFDSEKKGVIIDVQKNEIVIDNLTMPHSPRLYNNILYFFSSATEIMYSFNPKTNELKELLKIDGFLRGLDFYENYAFVGVSRLRKTRVFGHLDIAKKIIRPGIVIVDLNKNIIIGEIVYENGIDEVFDIKIIKNSTSSIIIDDEIDDLNRAIVTPDFSEWIDIEKFN